MQIITFSGHKQKIAEFAAQTISFVREDGGLLLSAEGEMLFQDTPSVENMLNASEPVHITIMKGQETVIDQPFTLTIFAFEANSIAVLLQ